MFLNEDEKIIVDLLEKLNRKHEMFLNINDQPKTLYLLLLTVNMKCF